MQKSKTPPPVGAVPRRGTAAGLRQHNSRAILEYVRSSGKPVRVAEIARATGLSRPTVETVSEGLLDQGWLRLSDTEEAAPAPSAGRPARLFAFNKRAGHVVGIDVGAHSVTVAVGDLLGGLIEIRRSPAAPDLTAVERTEVTLDAIASGIKRARISSASVLAMTVGTPGTISPADEEIGISPGIPGWASFDIKSALSHVVACDIELENDANLAALAERTQGVASGCTDMVFLLLGERLGAGIIVNGALVHGRDGAAGEVGYVPVAQAADRDPRYGPLESLVNASALLRLGAEAAERNPGGALSNVPLTAQAITLAATAGDAEAIGVVCQLANCLASGIAPTLLTLNPQLLVIGGGISTAGEVLRSALSEAVQRLVLYPPEVRISALGDEAVAMGAIAQAITRVEAEVLARVSA